MFRVHPLLVISAFNVNKRFLNVLQMYVLIYRFNVIYAEVKCWGLA